MSKKIGVLLPTRLPIKQYKVKGKRKSPVSGIKIPSRLPMSIGRGGINSGGNKTSSPLIFPIYEKAKQIRSIDFPINETAWDFKGIILEETIVDWMNTGFAIYEDVRSRILTDIIMIDKNHVRISWYGQKVNEVMIMRKSQLDDEYEIVATVPWDSESYIVEVSDDATNLKLEGVGSTGESATVLLEDGFSTEIKTDLNIALNTKVHYLESKRESIFRLKVNY